MITYINLTNGLEAIPSLAGDYRFVRLQSTLCEQKLFDQFIQEVDYDLLMNLALGRECQIIDFGSRSEIPRALWQGCAFLCYILEREWLKLPPPKHYYTQKSNDGPEIDCGQFFEYKWNRLARRTKHKIEYFEKFLAPGLSAIKLDWRGYWTTKDGDFEFYRQILIDNVYQKD